MPVPPVLLYIKVPRRTAGVLGDTMWKCGISSGFGSSRTYRAGGGSVSGVISLRARGPWERSRLHPVPSLVPAANRLLTSFVLRSHKVPFNGFTVLFTFTLIYSLSGSRFLQIRQNFTTILLLFEDYLLCPVPSVNSGKI